LFYVALTRARDKVFLTHTHERLWLGEKPNSVSHLMLKLSKKI
jgi:superfamily I DNA/RNA helicase